MGVETSDLSLWERGIKEVLLTVSGLLLFPALGLTQELPLVAVTEFVTTYDRSNRSNQPASKPENFEIMVETQLLKVGRFRLFERNKLEQILQEQGLQKAIGYDQREIAIEGVDYLIYGSITDFTNQLEEFNTGNLRTFKLTTRFGVDVKISDASTGEIRRAETITIETESGSGIVTGNFSQSEVSSSGLVDTQRKVAKLVTALLAESIFPIRVVDVEQQEIYLNYGDSILTVGDTLRVLREGRELIDPETGKSLGSTENVIATARVTETNSEFSKAEILTGEPPNSGDIVRVNVSAQPTTNQGTTSREYRGRKI